jgi:hypothetical protein
VLEPEPVLGPGLALQQAPGLALGLALGPGMKCLWYIHLW